MLTLLAVLNSEHRLRKTGDFNAVYKRGRSYVHPAMVVYVLRRDESTTRIGFSISKKLGGAVTRNRIKRRLREASRDIVSRLIPGTDAIVVARSAIAESSVAEIAAVIEDQLRRANALLIDI